jgi:hypothetical protein
MSIIRPIFEYADVVRDNITVALGEGLDQIQIEAVRIITGATKLVLFIKLYKESFLNLLKIENLNINLFFFIK